MADGPITFHFHEGQSCQNYAEEPPVNRDLDAAKEACLKNDLCNAIECPHKSTGQCTLRVISNPIAYPPADCYVKIDPENERAKVHPMYNALLKEYPFQEVRTQNGQQVRPSNLLISRASRWLLFVVISQCGLDFWLSFALFRARIAQLFEPRQTTY